MITRDELTDFLAGVYHYEAFNDQCENGLQVEGKDKISKIVFGVSFNLPLLDKTIEEKADALIVHHGIFASGFFKLKGSFREKIKRLLDHGISLYGIHLPMDANPIMGHNALILNALGAGNIRPFEMGYSGDNERRHTLDQALAILHGMLHPAGYITQRDSNVYPDFSLSNRHGFDVLANGPVIPLRMGVISGSSSGYYEKAVEAGIDTFLGGDMKEKTPGFSLETKTNFVNLGHYYSEKPGILQLEKNIAAQFDVETVYIEIPNPL